jgi:nitrate reductase gamma subunit
MGILYSVSAILGLILLSVIGVGALGWTSLFAIVLPYLAVVAFVAGFVYRVLRWASVPVPFHIPTVGGQQKSLGWIKSSPIDSPHSTGGVVARLALEILLFRSLLKNETVELQGSRKLSHRASLFLWLGGMAFHWSFLVILLRHLRFFLVPVPSAIVVLQRVDSILQNLLPLIYITDVVLVGALAYLFVRRWVTPHVRYISLPADYFVILLLGTIALSGLMMRLVYNVDLFQVKGWISNMLNFHPTVPQGVNLLFYIHLFFVCLLLAYFPVSKLMHLPGVFLSPTRNLMNTSRNQRHVNPWNAPVKVHTYEEYEEEFRESMKEVGLPTEKG